MAKIPKTIKATIAKTLIAANQNSLSAKIFTEKKLLKKINTIHVKLQIHTGTLGNHFCMIKPAAVNSDPRAIVHVSQYKIATINPVEGPIYFFA